MNKLKAATSYWNKRPNSISLPVDSANEPINIGDKIKILHNGRIRIVTSITFMENNNWIISCDRGGGFILPDSAHDIEKV